MERLLLVILVALSLASCAGPPQSPYDGDCTAQTCNGHLIPDSGGETGPM